MQGAGIEETASKVLEEMCRVQGMCAERCQPMIKQIKAISKRGDHNVEAVFRAIWEAFGHSSKVNFTRTTARQPDAAAASNHTVSLPAGPISKPSALRGSFCEVQEVPAAVG